jgi:4-amino-4-deoxy-L-arabinose transferase-like glycosyltransferase
MLMTVFLSSALGFFALARFQEDRRNLHLGLFYASVGLAFLVKGPVTSVIVIWTAILFYLPDLEPRRLISPRAVREDVVRLFLNYRIGWGVLIFLAIAGPWYVAMMVIHGGDFIHNFIFDENIRRFSDPLFGHSGTTTRYFRTIVHGTFPWGCLLPLSILFLFSGKGSFDDSQRQKWFFAAWAISVFSIFTIAGTKLDHYLLPIMPALAVLIALFWERYLEDHPPIWVRPALLLSPLFLLMPVRDFVDESNRYIFSVFMPAQDIFVLEDQIVIAVWVVFWSWTVAVLTAGWARQSRFAPILAFMVALSSAGFFLGVVVPAHAEERSLKVYADKFAALENPESELVFHGWIRNSIYYYHGSDYRYFEPEDLDELVRYVDGKTQVYIVAQEGYIDTMLDELHRASPSRWTLVSDDNPRFSLITNNPANRLRRVVAD